MRIRVSLAIVLAALLVLPGALFAQSKPAQAKPAAISVTLEYFENNSGIFDVKDAKGASVPDPQFGSELKLGWTVVTGKGDIAELKMTHTGTIIKVAQSTNFTLNQLRSSAGGQDVFALTVGKIRTVAGKASGKDQYRIKTQSAVCGVRGSDVVIETLEGAFDKLSTIEGTGWIQNSAGQALDIAEGYFADAQAPDFKAFQIPKDILDGLLNDMKFIKLDANETLAINKAYQATLVDQPGTPGENPPTTPPAPKTNSALDNMMTALRDILGLSIGSTTIDGQTWATVSLEPTFTIGKLKTALYLPIIYQGDMFNPGDYYHPLGNNEWSFGFDKSGVLNVVSDVLRDLLLKIKYVEWGVQRDPFFFKLGNLEDITVGHGLIMRNFANDADFPSIRRVGANLGMDFGGYGFEAMVNDAAAPDIFGGRLYVRPIPKFKMALGFSALVDLNPGKDWIDGGGADAVGDPIFINPGIDLDVPIVESDIFSIVAFADGAVLLPYFRSQPTHPLYTSISSGWALDAVYDANASLPVKNWGVAAGFFGNLIIRDFTWRLEFRDYTGSFIPQIYSSNYERQRNYIVTQVLDYLVDPTPSNAQNLGIFGEGGITLKKLFALKLSYFWPWEQDSAGKFTFADDQFAAVFTLQKGVIPVVNIWGSVSYVRTNFMPTILHGGSNGLSLFDANTLVSARINYPISDNIDVSLLYTTTARRNADGTVYYENPGDLLPQLDTSLSIMTTVHL